MADGQAPLLVVLRFLAFATLVVVGPGVSLQRLVLRRWDPALVVPLGLLFGASAYGLSLVVGPPWLFATLVVLALVPLLRPGLGRERTAGPPLRGAIAPLVVLVALFALTQYRLNRIGPDGQFRLDLGEHIDTAVHVGVTWELVAGYPPQVPGLAGVEMGYHVGSHLVRAAAARWAGLHPYDSMSRFDITLWALGLVLVLRAAAHALGLGAGAVTLAGYLPLVADLSWIPGAWLGSEYWAFKLGGNLVEALFYANSISPALALSLGALVALVRAEKGEGRAWGAVAAALAAGAGFFKVFTGVQLLLACGTAWLVRRADRRSLVVLALPVAAVLVLLVAGSASPPGTEGVHVAVAPFAPANPARIAFGLPEVGGLPLALSGLAWILLSLGVRIAGVVPAVLALRAGNAATATLAAFALWGWPLATFVRITADPSYDESFYFVQASGLALLLLAAPGLAAPRVRGADGPPPSRLRAGLVGLLALACLLPTAEYVARHAAEPPLLVPAATVRAMAALRKASCPGDVVLTRPGVTHVPLPVVLAGRRVAFANYIPYWRQFTTPEVVAEREQQVRAFLRSRDSDEALAAARELGGRFVYLPGRRRDELGDAGVLEPVFSEGREHVYRIAPLAPAGRCPAEETRSGTTGRGI